MTACTDDERREVARRLRGDPCDTLIPCRTGIHFGMGCHEAANRFWDMCERIKSAGDYDIAHSTRSVLADLIEPSGHECVPGECSLNVRHDSDFIDRDALLALADEIEYGASSDDGEYHDLPAVMVAAVARKQMEYARRIREACGEEGA